MASSLRIITSNLITKLFWPTVVSTSRFLASVEVILSDDIDDQSWLKITCPKKFLVSFHMWMDGWLKRRLELLDIPDEGQSAEHNISLIEGNEGMKEETLMVTLPKKDEIMASITANIIASFRDITPERSWLYSDMFSDRSILGKELCPIIAMLSPINSFSMYKNETAERLDIKMSMPGKEKMKLTTQGLYVSLPEIGEVKTFFDYDTFFIEGKRKTEHYITGIHLPKGIRVKHNMIKREMKDEVFYASLACCVKKDEIKDQSMIPKVSP